MAFEPENLMKASTEVFWYIDDCKVPEDIKPFYAVDNIKSALNKNGYCGRLTITVYGDYESQKNTFKVLRYAGVDIVNRPAGNKDERVAEIIVDVFSWAMNRLGESNLMIISEDFSGVSAFVRAIQKLHYARRCNILLAQPQFASGPILNVIGNQWLWTSLAAGGDPEPKRRYKFPLT
ncbi:NYN domain limkain-b1-type [Arabidopsis thaliana x Arabidopsis arenosa]|uniref:NYN domain limkain-b1-type n=1 Tax=Arabidopsis thaliana x Arabidopsis arenosa TaxID=1240361 RepID=A0A8T2C3N6_9BRAS|nr:NYN domain limkain-b1-type [Arabidopsis thaliana x Arabidopsis arenosa]